MKTPKRRTFLTSVAGVLGASTVARGQSSDHFLIAGGGPERTIEYTLSVDGTIERVTDSGGAPIADRHVTSDADDTVRREGQVQTVRGATAGGADAFRLSGNVVDFSVSVTAETTDAVDTYWNGNRIGVDELGPSPSAGTPITFLDGHTVRIEGDWADVRGFVGAMFDGGYGTDHSSWGSVDGPATLTPTWIADRPYALNAVGLHETDHGPVAVQADNPFAGPWNLESSAGESGGGAGNDGGTGDDGGNGDESESGDQSLPNHLVVFGGGGGTALGYEFSVSGDLRKDDSGGQAPIEDQYVTVDADDTVSGSTASGSVAGGGDAYRFSGRLTSLDADDGIEVFVNGNRRR